MKKYICPFVLTVSMAFLISAQTELLNFGTTGGVSFGSGIGYNETLHGSTSPGGGTGGGGASNDAFTYNPDNVFADITTNSGNGFVGAQFGINSAIDFSPIDAANDDLTIRLALGSGHNGTDNNLRFQFVRSDFGASFSWTIDISAATTSFQTFTLGTLNSASNSGGFDFSSDTSGNFQFDTFGAGVSEEYELFIDNVSVIPEPATISLVLGFLGIMAVMLRNRR
jgi:hypothetical protein